METKAEKERVPRAAECRQMVRRQIQADLPGLCRVLIAMALEKDLSAFRLLWQMGELDRKVLQRKGSGGRPSKKDTGFARKAMAAFHAR